VTLDQHVVMMAKQGKEEQQTDMHVGQTRRPLSLHKTAPRRFCRSASPFVTAAIADAAPLGRGPRYSEAGDASELPSKMQSSGSRIAPHPARREDS
jgi:hypothetical protein